MAAPTNHWKLGLFIVVGMIAGLSTLVWLGARSLQKKTVSYVTFFDESVQGLDVGSPVKYRGVTVGNVGKIDVAPDHRHVSVTCELGVAELDALGLNSSVGSIAKMRIPEDLRMQLASAGITGVKFILIDFFPVADNPVPTLPFAVPMNYIPSASSTMKNVEDAVVRAVNRIPEIADEMLKVMGRAGKILDEVDHQHLSENIVLTMGKLNLVLTDARSTIKDADVKGLSKETQEAIRNLNVAVTQMGKLVERLQSDKGVLANAERASTALGDLARNAHGVGPELEETLREVSQAAQTIQRLGDALDRDGDMLIKGRSKVSK